MFSSRSRASIDQARDVAQAQAHAGVRARAADLRARLAVWHLAGRHLELDLAEVEELEEVARENLARYSPELRVQVVDSNEGGRAALATATGQAAEMVAILRRIRDSGATIVLVEHDMPAVMQVSDMVLVLEAGALIAQGAPEVIARDPRVEIASPFQSTSKKALAVARP